jgi:membrane-associated phospholipid phosphatase
MSDSMRNLFRQPDATDAHRSRPMFRIPKIPLPTSFDRLDRAFDTAWEPMRRRKGLNHLFYTASEVGDFGMVWLAIAAAQAALGPDSKTKAAIRMAAALGVESVVVNGGIKSLFARERPEWEQHRPMQLRKPRTSSFPSGHSSSAVTAALLFTQPASPWAPLYWFLASAVALSRVHVKIHHVSDVAGGLAVGAVIGTLVRRLWPL